MSRAIFGLVALFLVSALASAQTAQTFSTQNPDGAITIRSQAGVPQPARDVGQPKSGTSRIRGRAVAGDNGQPLRRAQIGLSSPELREGRTTLTDEDGRYEFTELAAGRYSVSAVKTGYVTISFGQRRPNEPGRPLELADKQVADKIDFALPRAGIITGRIVDEYGEPVANAMVQPMSLQTMNGTRRPLPSGTPFTTPDTGEFRLWGLAPGDYYISVNVQRINVMNAASDDRSGYATSYFPGTPNIADAQPVSIAVGQTASGVDIVLMPTRTARISGTAIDSKGLPLRNGMVMAMPRASGPGLMMASNPGQIRPDGTFTLTGITPGEYTLRANVPPTSSGVQPDFLTATVTVAGEDISGIVLMPVQPIKITGKITLDPPTAWLDPTMVRVMAMPKDPGGVLFSPGGGPPIVREDLTFETSASPGTMMIRASPATPGMLTWTVKSVRVADTDIVDSGIELVSGRDLNDVEIVVTNRVQVVSGLVTNTRGQIAQDATVLVFPENAEQRLVNRFIGTGRPDQNGRYTIRNLPPGEYFAVALEYVDPNRRGVDPAYFEDLSRGAARLSLGEGETKSLDVRMSEGR